MKRRRIGRGNSLITKNNNGFKKKKRKVKKWSKIRKRDGKNVFCLTDCPPEIIASIYTFMLDCEKWNFSMSRLYFNNILRNNPMIFYRIDFFAEAFCCNVNLPEDSGEFCKILSRINVQNVRYLRFKLVKNLNVDHINAIMVFFKRLEVLKIDTSFSGGPFYLVNLFNQVYGNDEKLAQKNKELHTRCSDIVLMFNKPSKDNFIKHISIDKQKYPCFQCSEHLLGSCIEYKVVMKNPTLTVLETSKTSITRKNNENMRKMMRLRNKCFSCESYFCNKCSRTCLMKSVWGEDISVDNTCYRCIVKLGLKRVSLPKNIELLKVEDNTVLKSAYCTTQYILKCGKCGVSRYKRFGKIFCCCVCKDSTCDECGVECLSHKTRKCKPVKYYKCKFHDL